MLFAYNVAALEDSGMEPPPKDWTWDDVIEWGVAVTRDVNGKRPNEDGFDANEVDIWGVAYWQHFAIQEYLPWTAGQLYVDETGTKATIDNDGVRDSLQYLRDAYASGAATEKPPEKGLASGKVVFQEVGNWGLLDFEMQIGEGGLGALYTPSHPVHRITATPWYDKELWMPVQDDKDREAAAYQFSEWWALGDPYLEFCLETGYFPFTKSHFADQRWLDAVEGKEFMQIAAEMPAYATNTRFWALFKGAQEAQQSMYELVGSRRAFRPGSGRTDGGRRSRSTANHRQVQFVTLCAHDMNLGSGASRPRLPGTLSHSLSPHNRLSIRFSRCSK